MKNVATKTTLRSIRRQGQGMTEYVIIVGLVAVMMIPAVSHFKNSVGNAFDGASDKITRGVTDQLSSGG